MRIKKLIYPFIYSKPLSLLILSILFLIPANGYTSFELNGSGARSHALGQAYVGLANTPDALYLNCSGLAQLKSFSCSVFYTRPFGMKDLPLGSFSTIMPTTLGNFAAGFTSFGNEIYREQTYTFSFDRAVKQKIYFGFNLHYMKLQIASYSSDFSIEVDAGFLIKMTPNLNWGFFATNLNRATLGQEHDCLPQTICIGFSIFPESNLILNLDVFKDSMFPLELRCGIEYLFLQRIALRSGFVTEPAQFSTGIGFLFTHFSFDYAITTHTDLGLTHYLSVQISVNSKRKK